jgi:hypothetical protein
MSARPPDAHFGALQQKERPQTRRHCMRLRHPSDAPARLAERRGVLYNGGKRDGASADLA